MSIKLVVYNPVSNLLDVSELPLASSAQIVTADVNGIIDPSFSFGGMGVQQVAFSATPTFDAGAGRPQRFILTGNVTASSITNAVPGGKITFIVVQDGTGGWNFTWPPNVLGAPDMSTTPGTSSLFEFVYDGSNWMFGGLTGYHSSFVVIPTNGNFNNVPFNATLVFDAGAVGSIAGGVFRTVLTGNVTSSSIINPSPGQTVTFIVVQDATGGRTFTWPTNLKGAIDMSTTAQTSSVQKFTYDGTNWLANGLTGQ